MNWIDVLLLVALAIALTVAVAIPRVRGYAVGAAGLLAGVLGLRPRKGKEAPKAPPPPPKHTADEHETAIVLETADSIDESAAAHDADPNDVAELVELADKTRSK